LDSVRPAGAAAARHHYEQRHRARVLSVAIAAVVVAVIAAGGGFALHTGAQGTIPAGRPTPIPTPAPSTSSSRGRVSAPPPPAVGTQGFAQGTPSGSAPSGVRITSVTAIGVNTLWAVGYAPCTGHAWHSCPAALSSHDAGHTWTSIPAPGTAPYRGEIRFANNRDGWVIAQAGIGDHEPTDGWGVLYATHDGGSTWRTITAVASAAQVEAAAGQVWVTTGSGTLYTASVTGDAFSAVGHGSGVGLVVHGRYAYTYPPTWQLGDVAPTLTSLHDSATAVLKLPCAPQTLATVALATTDDTHLALVCGATSDGTGQDKTAYGSADAGATWTPLGTPAHTGLITSLASSGSGTFLAGSGMPVEATRDQGVGWPTVLAMDAEGGFVYVGFTDDQHGFALGGVAPAARGTGRIHLTVDGGRTWITVTFDGS
jgi:hypothetical protein